MKTKLKKQLYKLLITILVAITIVISFRLGLFTPHHNLAQRPDILYRIVDVKLPDTLRTEQYDNLDRTASSFDCFDCIITFKDTLSNSTIAELDYLCQHSDNWEKQQKVISQEEYVDTHRTYYCYTKEGMLYNIVCIIYNDHAKVEYSIDELEGVYLFLSLLAVLAIIVSIQILRLIIISIKLLKNHHTNPLQQSPHKSPTTMKPLLILPIALLLTFTSCANAPKVPLSERELIQQVFGNLIDTNRTIMDGYDEYHAFADSLLYHMETVKERKMRIGARCIAQEIIGSMTNESEYISAEEVAFFVDTLLQHYSLIQDYWHVDTINDGYWFSCENVILHQEKTKITELNVHIMEEGIFVLIDFPWDAVSNPVITFFDEEYKPVEDVRFDAKTEDVSVTNRSEDKTLSMFLHQDCFDAMLKYPYMWIEYVSDDSALEKDPPIVQQLIPLWHLFNTTMRLFVQK